MQDIILRHTSLPYRFMTGRSTAIYSYIVISLSSQSPLHRVSRSFLGPLQKESISPLHFISLGVNVLYSKVYRCSFVREIKRKRIVMLLNSDFQSIQTQPEIKRARDILRYKYASPIGVIQENSESLHKQTHQIRASDDFAVTKINHARTPGSTSISHPHRSLLLRPSRAPTR